MNEVDKLYHEWREDQRRAAESWRYRLRDQNPRWFNEDPEYMRAQAVDADSKALKEFIARNEDEDDSETEMQVKFAKEELKRRQEKYSELAVQIRKKQLETRETIKTKGRKTMAQTTKSVKVNTKIDVAALVQAKMAEKMMDAVGDGKDIPLTKLTIMQSLANGGSIDVNELIRAKQTEKLLKDLNENKDLSIGKLLTYQALTNEDGFDVNALIQAQFVEKLFADEK